MTNEEKQILFIDLCARLPYGVKCYAYQFKIDGNDCECCGTLAGINNGYFYLSDRIPVNGGKIYDERYLEVKPYLRPMSSMTDEEIDRMWEIYDSGPAAESSVAIAEYLYERHLDCHHLIEEGLALEVPKDMYKIE